MPIDAQSPMPVFEQVADHIRRAVAAGVYRSGELVPSLRALALELLVNPNTVQRAYEALEREGLIQPRRGVGMAVTINGTSVARAATRQTVERTFRHGIAAGTAAGLGAEQIRNTFEEAWRAAGPDAGSSK